MDPFYLHYAMCTIIIDFHTFSRSDLSVGRTLFAGGMAGMCNWGVCIPVDVLKSRFQIGEFIHEHIHEHI